MKAAVLRGGGKYHITGEVAKDFSEILGVRLGKQFLSSQDSMVLMDRDTRVLAVNPATLRILNTTLETVQRCYMVNYLSPSKRPDFIEAVKSALAGKKISYELDIPNPVKIGENVRLKISMCRVLREGRSTAVLMTVIPIEAGPISKQLFRTVQNDEAHSQVNLTKGDLGLEQIEPKREAAPGLAEAAGAYEARRDETAQPSKYSSVETNLILEKRAAQLSILNLIGRQLAGELDLDKALRSAVDLLYRNFGFYAVAVYIPAADSGEAVLRAQAGAETAVLFNRSRLKLGEGLVGWVIENRRTRLVNDFNAEISNPNIRPLQSPTRCELTAPIIAQGSLVGVLDLQSPLPFAFEPDDVGVIETVASQLGIAAANANLYAQLQQQLLEKQKAENLLRMQRDMLAAVGQTVNFPDALEQIISIFSPLHVFDSGSIFVLAPEGGLRAVAHRGLTPEFRQVNDYLPPEAHKTRFIMLGKPGYFRYSDLNLDPRIPSNVRDREGMLSIAALPILYKGKVIANLSLGSHTTADIPNEVRPVMEAVAEQLGAVISRLILEDQLKDRASPKRLQ